MSIYLCLGFARMFVDTTVYILRIHIQSIPLVLLAHQRQSYLMANEKGKKRATIPLSISIINAKATLTPETIAAIAFHPLKTYERKLLERV